MAGTAVSAIGAIVLLDRAGKGIRTAPRDAMISLSTPEPSSALRSGCTARWTRPARCSARSSRSGCSRSRRWRSTRSSWSASASRSSASGSWSCSSQPQRRAGRAAVGPRPAPSLRGAFGLLRIPRYRALLLAGGALSLATASDAFIFLALQDELDLGTSLFPLLFVGSAGAYMLLAVPMGRLADRVGRGRVLLGGYALLLAVYAALLLPLGGRAAARRGARAARRVLRRDRRRADGARRARSFPRSCAAAASRCCARSPALARLFASLAVRRPVDAVGDRRRARLLRRSPWSRRARSRCRCWFATRSPRMSSGRRRALFVFLVAACSLGVVAAVARRRAGRRLRAARRRGRWRSTARRARRGPAGRRLRYGSAATRRRAARSPLRRSASPAGARSCRCAATACISRPAAGLCLARGGGFAAGYRAQIFGPDLRVRHEVDVAGIPSRARVSPDGRYGSVTLFVTGHSYADAGSFSTQTTLIDLERGTKIAELEDFTVTRERHAGDGDRRQLLGRDVRPRQRPLLRHDGHGRQDLPRAGVGEAAGGARDPRERRVPVALARRHPDGVQATHVAPTSVRGGSPSSISRRMRETPLAELRSVDDQAEWLDDSHVLYGIDGEIAACAPTARGRPGRFAAAADSPAVVRW